MKLWELLPLALLGTRICWMSSVQGAGPSAPAVTGNTTSAWTTTNPAVTNGRPTNSSDTSGGTNSTGSGGSWSSGSRTTTQPQRGNSAGSGCSFSSVGLLLCSIMVQLTWSC